jgi:hypothetical protein
MALKAEQKSLTLEREEDLKDSFEFYLSEEKVCFPVKKYLNYKFQIRFFLYKDFNLVPIIVDLVLI